MADDLRLHFFSCGTVKTYVHLFKMHQGLGEPIEIPMPWFLIVHPKGNVVIDGGNTLELARDPNHWGEPIVQFFWPELTEDDFCLNQLAKLGVDPGSVRYVVQTHLHTDHCGALGHFPGARFLVRRREVAYAHTHDWYLRGIYKREDYDHPEVDWLFLEDEDDGYDLYGDGTIRLMFTPGHSPGHMSVVVDLPKTGPVMLTIDACFMRDHYENRAMPGVLSSGSEAVASVAKIRRLVEQTNALVVPGHDPDDWLTFRHAPDYYV